MRDANNSILDEITAIFASLRTMVRKRGQNRMKGVLKFPFNKKQGR